MCIKKNVRFLPTDRLNLDRLSNTCHQPWKPPSLRTYVAQCCAASLDSIIFVFLRTLKWWGHDWYPSPDVTFEAKDATSFPKVRLNADLTLKPTNPNVFTPSFWGHHLWARRSGVSVQECAAHRLGQGQREQSKQHYSPLWVCMRHPPGTHCHDPTCYLGPRAKDTSGSFQTYTVKLIIPSSVFSLELWACPGHDTSYLTV